MTLGKLYALRHCPLFLKVKRDIIRKQLEESNIVARVLFLYNVKAAEKEQNYLENGKGFWQDREYFVTADLLY